ncbi:hypothetical protein AD998_11555 [bacterium 336/3]|nr:hypothetical protein AD998_11555 [bacterium 336/3]
MNDTIYNALRYSLVQQIQKVKSLYISGYYPLNVFHHHTCLNLFIASIEAFDSEDFILETPRTEILNIITQSIQTDFEKKKDVSEILLKIHKQLKIDLKKAHTFPEVPYRKPINEETWEYIWKKFDEELKFSKWFEYANEYPEKFIRLSDAIEAEEEHIYYVHKLSYRGATELSGKWFSEMYAYDNHYWISKDFSWALYAEPNGYPEFYGNI